MINRILGVMILVGTLALVYLYETSSSATGAFRIFHWPAMVLTGIGPIGIVLLCSDSSMIREALGFLLNDSPTEIAKMHDAESASFRRLSQNYYTKGAKAFDEVNQEDLSPAARKTMDRLSTRMPLADVRDLVKREQDRAESHLVQAINLLSLGVRLSPSVGMLGTILGMTQLLANLSDPSHIGSHMSLALLTTFYGLFFSLCLWTPLQHRLERLLEARGRGFEQILHWLELLEQRKPAQYFDDYENGHDHSRKKRAIGLNGAVGEEAMVKP